MHGSGRLRYAFCAPSQEAFSIRKFTVNSALHWKCASMCHSLRLGARCHLKAQSTHHHLHSSSSPMLSLSNVYDKQTKSRGQCINECYFPWFLSYDKCGILVITEGYSTLTVCADSCSCVTAHMQQVTLKAEDTWGLACVLLTEGCMKCSSVASVILEPWELAAQERSNTSTHREDPGGLIIEHPRNWSEDAWARAGQH